jgi:hypothetical protein
MPTIKFTTAEGNRRRREREQQLLHKKPSPAKTAKAFVKDAIINTMREKGGARNSMDGSVPSGLVDVLQQIQCSLGSLDRAVKSQGQKVVEIESRLERKRGAEISCKLHGICFVYRGSLFVFTLGNEDDAGTRKKMKKDSPGRNFRYALLGLLLLL